MAWMGWIWGWETEIWEIWEWPTVSSLRRGKTETWPWLTWEEWITWWGIWEGDRKKNTNFRKRQCCLFSFCQSNVEEMPEVEILMYLYNRSACFILLILVEKCINFVLFKYRQISKGFNLPKNRERIKI